MRWLTQFWKPIDSGIAEKIAKADAKQAERPVLWIARYTAELDDGTKHSWTWEATFHSEDPHESAGNILLSQKYGTYGQVFNGVLYPPHRLRQVTWEIVS